ncbi:ParB/RepB/Spo0J family partition protein [Acinetobacter schindleri]|uniref:ParB/RepB/Spo0J family partition protein n=1 Tax=Acinetobacter schindleri TaxID=108981 RepID=UPI003F54F45D
MTSAKELLAQRLQQNTQKHQQAQHDIVKDQKEFRRNILISDISRSPYQPRKIFAVDELQQLADSISEVGLLQPVTVRKLENSKFELIAGERRLKAHELLNKKTIEVIIIDADDSEASLLTLAENLKRQDLTDYEIFLGLNSLTDEVKKHKQKLAKSLGLNREDMYKYLAFEKLPKVILSDLNEQPNLLGRAAATAFKKFLSDHTEDSARAESALLKAWENIKTKKLEQTKAVAFAEKVLAKNQLDVPSVSLVRKIEFDGKVTGNIKLDAKQLKVSLNIADIDEADLDKLEVFLKELIQKNKQV